MLMVFDTFPDGEHVTSEAIAAYADCGRSRIGDMPAFTAHMARCSSCQFALYMQRSCSVETDPLYVKHTDP